MDQQTHAQKIASLNADMSNQDILQLYGITEYTAADLVKEFQDAYSYKVEQARIFKILDAADHSDIWKVFNRKIPRHVQTPTHNPINIIKEATKASIMPTSFQGEFRALTLDARELANICNKYFTMKWENTDMDGVNNECADYAFLHGTSGVLFGWNDTIVDSTDISGYFNPAKHSQIQAKAWHPSNIFPDPTATSVEEMSFLAFAERKSKKFLKRIARFQGVLNRIESANDTYGETNHNFVLDKNKMYTNDVVTFITMYKRVDRMSIDPISGEQRVTPRVDVIYMAGQTILDISRDIEPNIIPFVPLYDEQIPNNFWGISKCYKVLSLVLTLNQLDSIEATTYFKNQNPAEFINNMAGLNVPDYQNKRDNPDKAFVVNCDPKLVQAFAQRPELPKTIDGFRQYLIEEIANISGVDAAYLGRNYGSIQTTGGVQQAVDRSTMRDSNRIKYIDKFIRKEIEVMVQFYIAQGNKEQFFTNPNLIQHDQAGQILEFDPNQLIAREDIQIVVSNVAPKSNQSYEDTVMKLMELQMKYDPAAHGYPDFITPEEAVNWYNIPKSAKFLILERMRAQQENMKLEEYTAVISALGQLVDGGMDPEQALMEVAKQIEASKLGQLPATTMAPAGNINGDMPK